MNDNDLEKRLKKIDRKLDKVLLKVVCLRKVLRDKK
jgi:hypothetical protein